MAELYGVKDTLPPDVANEKDDPVPVGPPEDEDTATVEDEE